MIRMRQTEVQDVYAINPKANVFGSENYTVRLREAVKTSMCQTILIDDVPVAIIGGDLIWAGVGKAWALISDNVKKSPVAFHKAVLYLLESYHVALSLHRVQFAVKADYTEGVKWAKSLGFEPEALMKQFGPNKEDYFLFVRSWS